MKILIACIMAASLLATATLHAAEEAPSSVLIPVGAATIETLIAPGDLAVSHDQIGAWISAAAHTVERYYQRFPVSKVHLTVTPIAGDVIHGVTYRGTEPLMLIQIGATVSPDQLAHDWVMTHEMVHLAFPPVARRHHWIEEGIATYVEPLARAQAGLLDAEGVWRWLLNGAPKGLPEPGDRGLDNTPTWGRTYWGGALFCLLADIAIRERTSNQKSLQDALRAVTASGGTMQQDALWPLADALEIGDRATGVPVLAELYAQMKDSPTVTDLDDLWRQLGVAMHSDSVTFDDGARLAKLRQALTTVAAQ